MSRDFARTQGEVTALELKIKSLQNTALKGGLMVGASLGILAMLKAPYEEAKKLAQAQADFSNLNLSAIDNSRVFGQAANLSHQRLGSTITGNIKLIQDLHTATGDLGKSLGMSDAYTQFSVAARVQNGGKDVDGLVINSIKALEHRGDRVMQNPAVAAEELRRQSQVHFFSKGRVSPSDYFRMSQTGKMAYTLADADFLYGPMAAFMSAKTGATAGTAQMTMLSSLVGGHMTKKAIGFLRGMGLWEDQASPLTAGLRAQFDNDPLVKKLMLANGDQLVQAGGLPPALAKLAIGNTNTFTLSVLAPAIRRKYGANMSDEQVAMLITQNFNRNTADDLSFWILNQNKVAKDSKLIAGSKGFGGAYAAYMKSPGGAEEAASAAWKNFLAMFGSVYLPKITSALLGLARVLDSLAGSAQRHPMLWSAVANALGFVALGLGLRGGGLLLSAAFQGLGLAMAFSSVGGAAGISKIGLALSSSAIGLSAIGKAAGLFMAAYAGWKVGGLLNDAINDKVKKNTGYGSLGEWTYDAIHQGTFDPKQNDGRFVKPAGRSASGKIGDIYLDGEKVGKHVARHVTTGISRPLAGVSGVDTGMFMLHPSMNTGR